MFGLAAVCCEQVGDSRIGKFESQSVPMITVGKCPNSVGIQFYNPENGTFISSIDYRFQNHVTSGAYFGLKYQAGVFIYRLECIHNIFAPKYNIDSTVYIHTHSPPLVATIIGIPTYQTPNIYTAVFKDGSISEYTEEVLSAAMDIPLSVPKSLLPHWIKGGANATLLLQTMSKPVMGFYK
jgi:hypothetical protein